MHHRLAEFQSLDRIPQFARSSDQCFVYAGRRSSTATSRDLDSVSAIVHVKTTLPFSRCAENHLCRSVLLFSAVNP
jgi:hypothetical protein